MTKLSVNINKIATIRNSRGGNNPDVVKAAIDCQKFGADGITEEIAAVPLYSSPIEIALDAEDEHVPLIVGADLAARESLHRS